MNYDEPPNYHLPNNWILSKFDDIISPTGLFNDGDWIESKNQDQNGSIKIIQLADIGDGTFLYKSNRFMTEYKASELKCTLLNSDDLLVARMPSPLGRACIFPGFEKNCVTVVDVCVIRPGNNLIVNKWLMYTINSPQFRGMISKYESGSTRKRISRKNLSKLSFPLPPLNEQHRIVEKIESLFSRLNAGVASLEAARTQLERYRQSVLKSAMEGRLTAAWREEHKDELEPASVLLKRIRAERAAQQKGKKQKELPPIVTSTRPELPEGWEWTYIMNVFDLINGRAFKPNEWSEAGIPIVRIQNLNNKEAKYNYCAFDVDEKYYIEDGELLFAWSGTPGSSFGAHIWDGGQAVLNQHIFKIRINENALSKIFIKYLLNNKVSEYISVAHGTAGLAHITKKMFEESIIPIPPIIEQRQIANSIERYFSIEAYTNNTIENTIASIKNQKQSILKKAFEGRLVPQDPTDEPASVLLERISAEREAQDKKGPKKNKSRNNQGVLGDYGN